MPPVTYPEPQDEMWCHRYYLRNLCDQIRFPQWPLLEDVEFLQSLLSMWREELTRRPVDLTEEEACAILEISSDETDTSGGNGEGEDEGKAPAGKIFGRVDEEILKRQYRRLAMRYHPDKNPQGREKFVAVQKAYERLQVNLGLSFHFSLIDLCAKSTSTHCCAFGFFFNPVKLFITMTCCRFTFLEY